MISGIDARTGRPQKRKFGPWIFPLLGVLARMRGLRGTPADVFGYSSERRAERRLITEYFDDVANLCARLAVVDHTRAVKFAKLPQAIRGFGPVKATAMEAHAQQRAALLQLLSAGAPSVDAAEDTALRQTA